MYTHIKITENIYLYCDGIIARVTLCVCVRVAFRLCFCAVRMKRLCMAAAVYFACVFTYNGLIGKSSS